MIWGAIGLNRRLGPVIFQNIGPGLGNGVNAQRYINQVLAPEIMLYFQQHGNLTLQQDNTCTHTARITTAFLQQHNIRMMPWPLMNPNLSPIKHFWDSLQRELNVLQPRPRTALQLEQAIRTWGHINMTTVNRLSRSMPARYHAVVNAN